MGLLVVANARELLVDLCAVERLDPLPLVAPIVLEVPSEVAAAELLEAPAVEVGLEVLERERVVEDLDVGDTAALLVLAFATPGTAIRAPPASAAADPARNFRREVGELSLRYVPSLICSLSLSPESIVLAYPSVADLTICALLGPLRSPPLAETNKRARAADSGPYRVPGSLPVQQGLRT